MTDSLDPDELFHAAADAVKRGDDVNAFELLLALAELGDVRGQRCVASMYDYGRGTRLDREKSEYWYRQAALQGHARSQFALACLLYHRDELAGCVEWLQKSSDQGFATATFYLAGMYYRGDGVHRDKDKGHELNCKASNEGDLWARMYVARALITGQEGVIGLIRGLWLRVVTSIEIAREIEKDPKSEKIRSVDVGKCRNRILRWMTDGNFPPTPTMTESQRA